MSHQQYTPEGRREGGCPATQCLCECTSYVRGIFLLFRQGHNLCSVYNRLCKQHSWCGSEGHAPEKQMLHWRVYRIRTLFHSPSNVRVLPYMYMVKISHNLLSNPYVVQWRKVFPMKALTLDIVEAKAIVKNTEYWW